MQYLLSTAARGILTRLARHRTLYGFDFDGTLSPIVDHPAMAVMSSRTQALLAQLAAIRPCIVLSGRALPDLRERLGGLEVAHIAGNHGAEDGTAERLFSGHVAQWKQLLEEQLGTIPGVWIEDKCLSLAVHYRQATDHPAARRRILAAIRRLDHVRVFGGKEVINVVSPDAPTKGDALATLRDRLGCDWVLYVGDDENDEDAFALPGNVVPVRIGRKKDTHARYFLRTQNQIDTLLELLLVDLGWSGDYVMKPELSSLGTQADRR